MDVHMVKQHADNVNELGDLSELLKDLEPQSVNKVVEADKNAGTPIFTEDEMYTSNHPLDQLIRFFLDSQNITEEEFKARHIKMHQYTSMPVNKGGSERSNILRSLRSANITWNAFERILHICGFDIVNMELDVQNRATGEIVKLSKLHVQEAAMAKAHPDIIKFTTDNAAPVRSSGGSKLIKFTE